MKNLKRKVAVVDGDEEKPLVTDDAGDVTGSRTKKKRRVRSSRRVLVWRRSGFLRQ